MYSSEDFERFYFQYQTEALLHGISMQSFCLNHKVPYNLFSKWYKDTRKKVVEVVVDGRPSSESTLSSPAAVSQESSSISSSSRILIELRMSNGLHVSQKNLSYRDLVSLVEKLKGLC